MGCVVMFIIETAMEHWLHGGTFTVDGFMVTVGPEGETFAVRDRGPVKRLFALIVMLEVADPPGRTVIMFGFALSVKNADTPDSLQAVSGCSSHPEKEWAVSFV